MGKLQVKFPLRVGGCIAAPARVWGADFTTYAPGSREREAYTEVGDYAVVHIEGPLEQHGGAPSLLHAACDTYDAIRARVKAALESNAPALLLKINSPGGDFPGSIELAKEIRGLAAAAGKRVCAFSDSQMLSAAYILACAADHIAITPSAFAGSIGVWSMLVDTTALDKAMGQNIRVIASGERKTDRNPHVPMSDGAVAAMQSQVDVMAGMFFEHVSDSRGLGLEAIEALQGSEVLGSKALSVGLVDAIEDSWDAYIAPKPPQSKGEEVKAMAEDSDKKIDEAIASLRAVEGDDEDAKKAKKALRAKAKKALDEMAAAEDGDGDEDDGKKAESEGEGKEKAEGYEDKKAAAAVAPVAARERDLVARVHALETQARIAAETAERTQLLSTRPDFSAQVRASLLAHSTPVEFVREACAKWPRGSTPAVAATSALTPAATRGETQGDKVHTDEASEIDRKMGFVSAGPGVRIVNNELELGAMTPSQVEAALKKLAAKGGV